MKTVISVANFRAVVSRVNDDGTGYAEPATNWADLEDEAAQALAELGGGINMSGIYPCPPALADRALWRVGRPATLVKDQAVIQVRVATRIADWWETEGNGNRSDAVRGTLTDLADGDAIAVKVDAYEHAIVATWLNRQIETLAASDPDDTTLLDWLTNFQDALADAFNRRHNGR